ncbi:MAG: aldehyde dehydrogenase family protein, partial [Trebonia sp.]
MSAREDAEALAHAVPSVPFADGSWQPGRGLGTFDVIDPVTERPVARVTEADPATVDAAVRAARAALDDGAWGRLDGAARG